MSYLLFLLLKLECLFSIQTHLKNLASIGSGYVSIKNTFSILTLYIMISSTKKKYQIFGKHVVLNAIPVQSIDSKNCGKHCLVFCYVMSKNKSINQFKKWMKTFSNYSISEREELSLAFFDLIFQQEQNNVNLLSYCVDSLL